MSQDLYDLPEGWEWVKLGNICDFVRGPFGGSLKKEIFKSSGFAVYEQQHAIYNQFDDIRYFIDSDKFEAMKRFVLQPDDIIMSCSGTMGKTAIVPKGIKEGIINQALLKLTTHERLYNIFLQFWMDSYHFQSDLNDNAQGAAIKNVASVTVLKEVYFPLPPLAEQIRIVEKLDAVLSRIDTAIDELQQSLALVDAMFKSGLDGVFAGFSKDITRMAFKDVVVNLDGQRVPIKSDERKSTHGTYPYYGATGIIDYVDEYIFDGENLLISEDGANLVARKYPIAFIATGKYWVNNHAHVVCAKPTVTTNSYLQWFFAWCDLSSYITGSAQPKLSQGKLNAIPVPIPALNVQDNIVCQLNTLNEQTTQLKNELNAKIGMFNQLKASVLDGAFRGLI